MIYRAKILYNNVSTTMQLQYRYMLQMVIPLCSYITTKTEINLVGDSKPKL